MKKMLLSAFTVMAFVIYALFQRGAQPAAATTASSSPATRTPTTAAASSGSFKAGTYTGSQEDAYYGTVQVKATIQGGKLTDVQFLSYPSDRRTSQQINSQAMPILTQEAIQAQSANVQAVTGATFTSQAFVQSLQTALAQAQA